jgi:hypothetical protein
MEGVWKQSAEEMFRTKRKEVTGQQKELKDIVKVILSRRMR